MIEETPLAPQRPPWHLWLVGILGLLWNSVGAYDYLMVQTESEFYMSQFNPEQLQLFSEFPTWLVAFWALAVWGGVLGALLVVLRRKLAVPMLLVSLLAMSVTAIHNFVSTSGLYASGGTGAAFVLLIFSLSLGLWLYARAMAAREVLI